MKKISIKSILLLLYEIVRIWFILKAAPVQDIPYQSLSWYVSVPLIIVPLMMIIIYLSNQDKFKELRFFISLSKLMSVVSFTAYFGATFAEAAVQVRFSQFYSIATLFFMMFFLLIDVIIGLLFIKKPKTEEENNLCK